MAGPARWMMALWLAATLAPFAEAQTGTTAQGETIQIKAVPGTIRVLPAPAGEGSGGPASPPATVAATSTTPSTAATPIAIVGGTLITITRGIVPNGTLIVRDGKIAEIGFALTPPAGARIIDANGKFVLPGIIDVHSHMGVYPWPSARAHEDGNEATDPLTPHMRAEDAVYLEDPAFERAREGGVTSVQIIPGSANLQGGQAVILKLRPANLLDDMKFEGAPPAMKMAWGENPKRVYGSRGRLPSTRMGNAALMRQAFEEAIEYGKARKEFEANAEAGKPTPRPEYNPRKEILLDVLRGKVRVHMHCYRKDDLLAAIRVAKQYGIAVASFQHGLEAYKIAGELARLDIGVATWPDWWGFKMEAWDAIPQNLAILAAAGVRVAIHSDSADVGQRLYTEAAKAVRYGMRPEHALKALTYWPATLLGVEKRVGSLEVGKDADIAIFTKHPFDVYTTVEKTLIDGRIVHDASAKEKP